MYVRVVLFDDMRGSTVLKDLLAEQSDEEAFHALRREHDRLVGDVVTRDGAGEVVKSTGDGVIALFERPSLAVERALEIQDRMHEHPHLRVRIGLDVGEVKVESVDGRPVDVFGRHVDWSARATSLASDGHICVTRPPTAPPSVAVMRPWEMVARDGRDFAANGAGVMYWFRVPLGGVAYPEGFRNFLQPALENDRITKIRFVLDATVPPIRRFWTDLVIPLVSEWAGGRGASPVIEEPHDGGRMTNGGHL